MCQSDYQNGSVEEFIKNLEAIPWFSNIGKPIAENDSVKQITSWDDWPGPEDDCVAELCEREVSFYEKLMPKPSEKNRLEMLKIWKRVHETVIQSASTRVPYDPNADAYHGPTSAVWQAAYTAGLVCLCLQLGNEVPDELQQRWDWYVRGHWPWGYEVEWPDDELGPLLIF